MNSIGMSEPKEVFKILKAGTKCQIVDVREYPEYEAEHVAGTCLVPLSELPWSVNQVDKSQKLYVLCENGTRSKKAAEIFAQSGHNDVAYIEGGILAWKSQGLPTETGKTSVWSMERQVRFAAGGLVTIGVLLGLLVHPAWTGLSAFVGAGLAFSAVTDTCGMAMVLAKLPWNKKPSCAKG